MTFKDAFPQQIKMIPLENTFKQLHEQFPERNLQLPHSGEYVSDILKLAAQKSGNSFPNKLLENRLEEELFFRSGFDTELYRHLRYLPANWHSHSFLEVVCVVEGQAVNYIQDQELHMCKGDICIIAPETVHAISAFSDDCIIINIVLRTSTFEKVFFGVLSDNDVLSGFFTHTLYHSKTHPYLFFRTDGDPEVFDFVFYAYREFLKNHQYKERFLNNIVGAFFIVLLRNHGSNVIVPEADSQGHDENVVFILKYMQETDKEQMFFNDLILKSENNTFLLEIPYGEYSLEFDIRPLENYWGERVVVAADGSTEYTQVNSIWSYLPTFPRFVSGITDIYRLIPEFAEESQEE